MTNELNPDIKWELEGVKLALPSYQINDKEFLEMTKRHKEHPLNTYLDQVLVNYLSISGKQKSEIFTDISPGLNPTKLYMLFQETSRFNGDYSLNPYKVRQIRSKKLYMFILVSVFCHHLALKARRQQGALMKMNPFNLSQ